MSPVECKLWICSTGLSLTIVAYRLIALWALRVIKSLRFQKEMKKKKESKNNFYELFYCGGGF